MGSFLQSCRQCYALIGLAVVVAGLLTVWFAGWSFNELGHYFGFLPYEYETCQALGHGGCWTDTYEGPESTGAVMFVGLVICLLFSGLCVLAKAGFELLENLGRTTVKSLKESL